MVQYLAQYWYKVKNCSIVPHLIDRAIDQSIHPFAYLSTFNSLPTFSPIESIHLSIRPAGRPPICSSIHLSSGGYAYIEASEPRYRGQKAILTSGSLRGSWCMRFKYHMHGSDVGSLAVYRGNEVMWSRSGDHGNQWLQGHVDIDCSHVVYEVGRRLVTSILRQRLLLKMTNSRQFHSSFSWSLNVET